MQVRELVGGDVVWVGPDATLRQAAETMMATEVGSVAVEVDGALEGILTERDLLRAVANDADLDREIASNWMTAYPDSFASGDGGRGGGRVDARDRLSPPPGGRR